MISIELSDPVLVETAFSAYEVIPKRKNNVVEYTVLKLKDLSEENDSQFPVGYEWVGSNLFLEVGARMILEPAGLSTSRVKSIEVLEPHH